MRWVGIDEAGYGPNLGPLVMTAVVAEGADERRPDLWGDLPDSVTRAGGQAEGLWIDDSKRVYRAGQGLGRLETACLVALAATGRAVPTSMSGLLASLEAGSPAEVELAAWLDPGDDPAVPLAETGPMLERALGRRPLDGAPWRIVAVRSVVVGPCRFNEALEATGSKAAAHFSAFADLLRWIWADTLEGDVTRLRADKHGGRHFYLDPLSRALPDTWIDRGPEGPAGSRYAVRGPGRRLEIDLRPRADADDGLVALASMISKAIRERWMGAFNAHWMARISGLRPTAGYPGDSARFRAAIEPECLARGLSPNLWWRVK